MGRSAFYKCSYCYSQPRKQTALSKESVRLDQINLLLAHLHSLRIKRWHILLSMEKCVWWYEKKKEKEEKKKREDVILETLKQQQVKTSENCLVIWSS